MEGAESSGGLRILRVDECQHGGYDAGMSPRSPDAKRSFGQMLRTAREQKGLSLRGLAKLVKIDYSRLAKIEHGTRPAPELAIVRRLSDVLGLDMAELVVAGGTSREVMENLVWSERLHECAGPAEDPAYRRNRRALVIKNVFWVRVLSREGALCSVSLGSDQLSVLSFSHEDSLGIRIPPDVILIHKGEPDPAVSSVGTILRVSVRKIRTIGQVVHLVLAGNGYELSALHARQAIDRLRIRVGDQVFATIPAAAISTGVSAKEER